MSTLGTFDAFTAARLGIYAAQQGFQVTGNNVSNINTEGYTRQRINQVSFKAGAYDRYRSQLENHVGSGALVTSINQIRDPYLDIKYRDTNADVGYYDTMLAGLQDIAKILDEVGVGDDTNVNKKGDGRLQAQIQAVSDALRRFSDNPTKDNNDLVRSAAETLCSIFHTYADKLEELRQETEHDFQDQLTKINECLTNIRDLNDEIRDNDIFGDPALELRDERNRQIDKLSELIHIKVQYSEEKIGNGRTVEKLSIYLDNDNPDKNVNTDQSLLIDGIFGAQLSCPEEYLVRNPHFGQENADGSIDKFLYLAKTDEDGNQLGTALVDGNGDPVLGADGKQIFGTMDPDEALRAPNTFYSVEISKLYNDRGDEWEGIHTELTKLNGVKAVYSFSLDEDFIDNNLSAGMTLEVGPNGTPVTITQNMIDNPGQLAAALARYLSNSDYVVTSQGTDLIFTARTEGEVNKSGPASAPTLTFHDPSAPDLPFPPTEVTKGEEAFDGSLPQYTKEDNTPEYGMTTITEYRQDHTGQWYKVETITQRSMVVGLDDNDLYGSLQATRELLTEAGEFSTNHVVDEIDENAAIKRGIPYYQYSLDLMARTFADEYNKLNNDEYVIYPSGVKVPYDEDKKSYYVDVVSIVDPVTGEPVEKPGYALDLTFGEPGYIVDENGYYLGLHNGNDPNDPDDDSCIISGRLNVKDSPEKMKETLEELGYGDLVGPDGDVTEALRECLKNHGVRGDEDTLVDLNRNYLDLPHPGNLFSNRGDRDNTGTGTPNDPYITASNISVSHSWSTNDIQLVPKYELLWNGELDHTTQNKNADHMVTLIDKNNKVEFDISKLVPDAAGQILFTGSFNDMYNNMCTILGEDQRASQVALNTNYTQLVEIDYAREGVSGVDLNDEAMNMMQYQKAYSAACRLMTVADEMLDRLINNTGIAGR